MDRYMDDDMMMQKCADKSSRMYGRRRRSSDYDSYHRKTHEMSTHTEFHNFMKNPPLQKMNIVPQSSSENQATFSFECDLRDFS